MRFPIRLTLTKTLCAATVMLAAGLATSVTPSSRPVPFRAQFDTAFTSVVNFPFVSVSVVGAGEALHMGRTTAATTNQVVNLLTGQGTATYDLTAANGDVLTVVLDAMSVFLPNGVTFSGTYVVTGGTGRFATATGSGTIDGTALNTGPNSGVGTFELDGVLSR
ncbi:MAG: hypothetical protein JNM84_16100 [Planctomycetes bacterium]|nr:hypothetical protein [Planctomycetota bacterium]